jgi:hypothetical protein
MGGTKMGARGNVQQSPANAKDNFRWEFTKRHSVILEAGRNEFIRFPVRNYAARSEKGACFPHSAFFRHSSIVIRHFSLPTLH